MIPIKPYIFGSSHCDCGGDLKFMGLLWQGLHVCEKTVCQDCKQTRLESLPVNQSILERYIYYPDQKKLCDCNGKTVKANWFSSKLVATSEPLNDPVNIEIEIIRKVDEVIIINTLDYIYGHSFLFLLNLQRILKAEKRPGIIVIVQPMLKWMVPRDEVAEIWTVHLGFEKFNFFNSDLSEKINSGLGRFNKVWLSKGHPVPTNENIEIERFTGIKPFDFKNPGSPRITFIWREDPDRLWIRNIFLLKGFKKLGLSKMLFPVHKFRVTIFFRLMKKKLGPEFRYTIAGLGKSGRFPSFVEDARVSTYNVENEKALCHVYAESELVIGVHGSSMLMPSAHAGMAISMMPSRRWGNYAEDILFREKDVRLASFQRRIIPLNLSIYDVCDIAVDMVTDREYFIKKFIHSEDL
jgi:hypothetical protein